MPLRKCITVRRSRREGILVSSRIRRWSVGVLGAVLLVGADLGCSRNEGERVASVGGAGSACELPVTFEIPTQRWRKSEDGNVVDPERSTRYASCDLEWGSGKTSMEMRVRVYDKGKASADPSKALLDYDGYGMSNYGEYYHDRHENRLTIAGHPAAEMRYTVDPPTAEDQSFQRRTLAVVMPDATILLRMGARNPGADERNRKVYDRVKSSLRITP
ncbi:lipoprotein [Streptomyces albulus]|uniref:lipoprotein n=1 Tax=Streptomyces noursei TaxID=1971 RepID=UPI001F348C62|nr:lipoprotein [Streptomyces noursei]MCE4947734.1 lipoprotein [Streptomyces noursei]